MTPFSDWPVRPRARRGESFAGYVYRLHSVNGHSLSPSAYQLLKACYCAKDPAADLIELNVTDGLCAFGEDMDLVSWNLAWRSFWWSEGLHRMADQPRRTGLQVCPCCLRELRFHLRFWELPLVRACPVHRCALLTHCKKCGQALNWHALQADWKHKCGQSLLEARPLDAATSDLGIADWLSKAVDAPPCGPAPRGNRLRGQISMLLRTQYRRLAELQEIRQLVISQLFPRFANGGRHEAKANTSRYGPNRWELRVVLAGPNGLRLGMQRWARRYLRQLDRDAVHQSVLLRLPEANRRALDMLPERCRSLREALTSLLNEYALQMPFERYVLFNPRIAEADKVQLLRRFRRWWLVVCLRVRSQQESMADVDTLIWLTDETQREDVAFQTLNSALRISFSNLDIGQCATVFAPLVTDLTWCPTDSAEDLLLRIAAQLMALPERVLKHLASESLAMLTELEAHQR